VATKSDALLSKLALKAADHLRAGGKIRPVEQARWSPDLANLIHNRVSEWLRTGDAEHLAALLKEFPGALAHPAVLTSVTKMRRLAAKVEVAELAADAELDGEFFSPETCRAARDTLHSIATALLSGVAGDEWCLTPRPQKRGRPKRTLEEMAEAVHILGEYERVLEFLRATEVKRGKTEPEKQWRERLKAIMHRAWTDTIGVEIRSEAPPPGEDLFAGKIISVPLDLPDSTVERGLDRVLESAGSGLPVRDVIAYSLVGHRWKMEPSSVKHLVEEARKLSK
jgi:hypothetical protein